MLGNTSRLGRWSGVTGIQSFLVGVVFPASVPESRLTTLASIQPRTNPVKFARSLCTATRFGLIPGREGRRLQRRHRDELRCHDDAVRSHYQMEY